MKVRKFLPVFWIIFLCVFLNSCDHNNTSNTIKGDGNVVSQEKAASGFHSVTLDGGCNVNIHHAENFKVVVTTDSNIQDTITVNVNESILYINQKSDTNIHVTVLYADVYMPALKNINLKGIGDIKIVDGKTSNFEIVLSGGGNIDAQDFEAENVSVTLSGIGDVRVWATKNLTALLSGGGNIDAQKYETENVSVTLSGIGDIRVWVTKSLTGILSGGGNIFYKGNPATININNTGIGNVTKM